MTDENKEQLWNLVEKLSTDLNEHFDSVQVLASIVDENGTRSFFCGAGNWFARKGMAHEFITRDEADTSGKELAKHLNL